MKENIFQHSKIALAAALGLALAFIFSCSSDSNDGGGGNNTNGNGQGFPPSDSQVYHIVYGDEDFVCNLAPYTGSDVIEIRYNERCDAINGCTWDKLTLGSVNNGIINFEQPQLPEEYIEKRIENIIGSSGYDFLYYDCDVSPEDAKFLHYSRLQLYDSNDRRRRLRISYLDNISVSCFMSEKYGGNSDLLSDFDFSTYVGSHIYDAILFYSSEAVKITCDNWDRKVDIDAKKGWSIIYEDYFPSCDRRDEYCEKYYILSTNPFITKGINWIITNEDY